MRTLFQALGAVFPLGTLATPARRRVDREGRDRAQRAAGSAPTTSALLPAPALAPARRSDSACGDRSERSADPYYLCVVPYLPRETSAPQRITHPRIVNPFRRFPQRTEQLFALMERAAAPDEDAARAA